MLARRVICRTADPARGGDLEEGKERDGSMHALKHLPTKRLLLTSAVSHCSPAALASQPFEPKDRKQLMSISPSKWFLLLICTATVSCSELKGSGVRIDAGGSGGGDEAVDGGLPEKFDALPDSDALPMVQPPDVAACEQRACVGGDACCPSGCNSLSDGDCQPSCGNGVVEMGESCDPVTTCAAASAQCLSDAEQVRLPSGSVNACTFTCAVQPRACSMTSDGHCPASCRYLKDVDCPIPNRLFVTARTFSGNLGGLVGADAKCQLAADGAALGGIWTALLGTSTTRAVARLGDSSGWVLLDGRPFAKNFLDVRQVFTAPAVDEHGRQVNAEAPVWTGFESLGSPSFVCDDWTKETGIGQLGKAGYGGGTWANFGDGSCLSRRHLYCAEVGRKEIVRPNKLAASRLAFAAPGWNRTSGLAGADQTCSAAATAAGHAGTFKAFLADPTTVAIARFNLSGAPWARIDGTPIVHVAADLANGKLVAPLNQTARGEYLAQGLVWTGMLDPREPALDTCKGWSSTKPPLTGHGGEVTATGRAFLSSGNYGNLACTHEDSYVYCLEESETGQPPAAPPDTEANVLFVTADAWSGDLGGVAGADEKCRSAATMAGLSGDFRAWLATDTTDLSEPLGSARGFVRPDGLPIAATAAELEAGRFLYPPNQTAMGKTLGLSQHAWTGTYFETCDNWTSDASRGGIGRPASGGPEGLFNEYDYCDQPSHLYCVGTNRRASIARPQIGGNRVGFVARGSLQYVDHLYWGVDAGGGLAGLDAQCNSEASLAGLAGTFKAAVATSAASAASRFDTTGAPWVRTDGVPLAATAAALFSEGPQYPLNLPADGSQYFDYQRIWMGAASIAAAGTADSTCIGWSSRSAANAALVGRVTIGSDWFKPLVGSTACDSVLARMYCLQH